MYTLTFSRQTIDDLLHNRTTGRQFFGALVIPYSGIFSQKSDGSSIDPPKLVCPYQVNDIIAIQEKWARSGSSYVYATGNTSADAGYSFRPAYTMPVTAARMYGRITSIKPWNVTKHMALQYLPTGISIDDCAGAAKVIGYCDKGTELLSTIRKIRNREVLNKTYQPMIPANLPLVNMYLPYYLREPTTYIGSFRDSDTGATVYIQGPTTQIAQAYDADTNILKSGETIDNNHGAWQLVTMDAGSAYMYNQTHSDQLLFRGEWKWSPAVSTPGNLKKFVYIVTNSEGVAYIRPQYYVTQVVDPDAHLNAWMISGYLCTKEGEIIGNWF